MSDVVLVDRPWEGAARLTIKRPEKRNALSITVRDAMSDHLDVLAADESVRCVVITGAGDVFSAGFDLKEFDDPDPDFQTKLWDSSTRWHVTLLGFPLPLVAAVNGPALAGGFDLATMCDLRVVVDDAWFAHPEHAWAEVVYTPLQDLVGGSVARDLCLTGRRVDAAEAAQLGLANRLVPAARLDEAVGELVAPIAGSNRDNLLKTKARIVRRARTVVAGELNI